MSKHVSCTTSRNILQLWFILKYKSKSQEHQTHSQKQRHLQTFKRCHFTKPQLPPVLLLWIKGTGLLTLWGLPLGIVGLSQRKTSELLLQTTYSQPHLVLSPLKRFQLHGVEDVQQKGGKQDGEAQRSQQVEGSTRERLFCSEGQPGHSCDGQLQNQQSQPHHSGACCCVAHALSAVQAHFDFRTGFCQNVHQLSALPFETRENREKE